MTICKACQHSYRGGEFILRCKKAPLPIETDIITGQKWAVDITHRVHISKPHQRCDTVNTDGNCPMYEKKFSFLEKIIKVFNGR